MVDPGLHGGLGGHLDSVTEGPGINDNASTASAVLQVALALAPYQHRVINKVRFAWWGAEELYDVGSFYYVDHLSGQQQRDMVGVLPPEVPADPGGDGAQRFKRRAVDVRAGA